MSNYQSVRENSPEPNNYGGKPPRKNSKIIPIALIVLCIVIIIMAFVLSIVFADKKGNEQDASSTNTVVSKDDTSSGTESIAEEDLPIPSIADDPSVKGYFSGNVFIYNNKGYEIFGGTDTLAVTYATILSDITDKIGDTVSVYNMIVPTNGEYTLPERYKQMAKSQKDNIEKVYSSYLSNVIPVDIYDTLNRHKLEYIYYNTDHHWTALGAYYGYVQFSKVYGFTPIDIKDLTKGEIEGFTGSFIVNTKTDEAPKGNEDLLSNTDTVEYYDIPGDYTCYLLERGAEKGVKVPLLYPNSTSGVYTYSKFIWGDNPYMRIMNNGMKNGKKLLVVKDSYGNVFVPYLVPNFEEVHVIDYRYYDSNVSDIIDTYGITDVLFINGIMSVNSSYHQNKLIELKW